ncbi:glutathione S-transferase N-terminal domain-containing protein [Vibrio sp. SCSIO 43135]|uniref:glutaredoxin family protein n=1 Tax=Vibrio sp. SCSIO 43135 TaxID=2819096 RepID=UPI002075A504|nr:glutaredoxin [Vibrio sp. SCSIO 43135]USD43739.1 glutathione S-transferase N-terminal domain-containing protein [Vibrio sp. SCSIO 43135]
MKFVRWFLGRIILLLNFVFSPKGVKRSQEAQKDVDQKAATMALYQFEACPFCVKVRRAMKRQSVKIELRDAKNDTTHRSELEAGGGRVKVPCLRIEKDGQVEWMYESSDIVAYLEQEFAA